MTKRNWLRAILVAVVLLFAATVGLSLALRSRVAHRYLVEHLAASFGRPVEVSWFDFTLLDGPRIEAHLVTVAEDPRFGNEYFLRADALTAGVRWMALLRGRFEFGSVSLVGASLNLTRNAEGQWNIERWLPPAPQGGARSDFAGPSSGHRDPPAARLYRINVNGGRINFKRGEDKSPFALVDVSGSVEQNSTGRWQLDLVSRPMLAGVALQDIGTFHLRGSIAGTTARLQPAEVSLTWRDASLADALRLLRQNDYGMRGQIAVDLSAHVAPPEASRARETNSARAEWSISAVARLTGIHGWNIPERGSDPAANLSVEADWRLGEPRVEIAGLLLEAPASRLQGSGELDWGHGFRPELRVVSSSLGFGDALSWYRALVPGVADDLRTDGTVTIDFVLGGWPIQFARGTIASDGATLTSKSLPAPARLGVIHGNVSRGGIEFAPTEISFAEAPAANLAEQISTVRELKNSFVLRGAISPKADGEPSWPLDWNLSVEGATPRVQDWLALSRALARPPSSGWSAAGGLAVKVRGVRARGAPAAAWLGSMDLLGLALTPAYVNEPVLLPKAHVELGPQQRSITLTAAEALGATWRGSITRKYSDTQWTFDLLADRLDTSELDRWLGPRARPGFFARLTGFGSSSTSTPPPDAIATRLAAHGRLRAVQIVLPPLHAEGFDGEVEIAGRTVHVRKAQADFFEGKISSSLDARLLPDPSYEFQGRFEGVNVAELSLAVPFLNDRVAGVASGSLALSAHGVGRENLVGSMEGQGTVASRNVKLRGLDLSDVFSGDDPGPASASFSSVQGTYRIRGRAIDLRDFQLDHERGRFTAEGRIDFSHALNIRVVPSIPKGAAFHEFSLPPGFLMGGTIESPKVIPPAGDPKPSIRPSARQR